MCQKIHQTNLIVHSFFCKTVKHLIELLVRIVEQFHDVHSEVKMIIQVQKFVLVASIVFQKRPDSLRTGFLRQPYFP